MFKTEPNMTRKRQSFCNVSQTLLFFIKHCYKVSCPDLYFGIVKSIEKNGNYWLVRGLWKTYINMYNNPNTMQAKNKLQYIDQNNWGSQHMTNYKYYWCSHVIRNLFPVFALEQNLVHPLPCCINWYDWGSRK